MSEILFDVVFYGILQAGKDKETAMQNMAVLFKTEPAKLAPYFAGGRKVIKAKVSEEIALKYQTALENVGLVIKLEEAAGAESSASSNPESDTRPESQPETEHKAPASSDSAPDTGSITVAPVGADVLENPPEVKPQPIGDISAITMAEVGADVLENPPEVTPQPIGDISDLTIAEVGADVLENPPEVKPQPIGDISDLSLAETGADLSRPAAKKG